MANPVMKSVAKQWGPQESTPAGYPTMPGYQPASTQASTPYTGAANPYDQQPPTGAPVYGPTPEQMAAYEAMLNAPAADAVDRARMTYDDVLVKSMISFGVLLLGAFAGWMLGNFSMSIAMMASTVSILIAVGLGLVFNFTKSTNPALVLGYAAFEGFAIGAISQVFERMYPGIVVMAVVATLAVVGVTLGAFAFGFIRNSPTLARIAIIGSAAFFIYYMASIVFSLTGWVDMTALDQTPIFGIPLRVIIGAVAVIIGAICLIQDFDMVKQGVAQGAPAALAWRCVFGIMVDVVWIYLEILRILSYFMRRD